MTSYHSLNSQKKSKKIKSFVKKVDPAVPPGLVSLETDPDLSAIAYEELTKLVDDLKTGNVKCVELKQEAPEESKDNYVDNAMQYKGNSSGAGEGWRHIDDEIKTDEWTEKLISERDECDKYHLHNYDQIAAGDKSISQPTQGAAAAAVPFEYSNVTDRTPLHSNIKTEESEFMDEDNIEHMASFENGLQSDISLDGSCSTIPTIGLHVAHLDNDDLNDGELSLLGDCYQSKEYGDDDEEIDSMRANSSPFPRRVEVAIVKELSGASGGGSGDVRSGKSQSKGDSERSERKIWNGAVEESKGAEEVLYWRQEVIQQHMESYPKGTLNPAISSQSRSYSITAGFDETALKGNPYGGPGAYVNTEKSRKYLNFFSIERKSFNENGKEIVQILKIWISPFWSVFQFAARFFFVTVPSFGFNLMLEFNYLLFKIAKRVAAFWFAMAFFCFFSLPYQVFCYSCKTLLTLLLSVVTKTLNNTPGGAKIVKRIEREVKQFKSGKSV